MKTPDPFFSVIIPTYNRAKLVLEAVHSVLAQTNQDFEIIVVDNGSSDDTRIRISAVTDERIQYYYCKPTGGPAWPRNLGLEKARGQWICFLDSDDLWLPQKLEEVKSSINNHSCVAIAHWQQETDLNGAEICLLKPDPKTLESYERMLVTENTIVTSTVCIKKKFIDSHSLRFKQDKNFIAIEDYDFWLQLLFFGGRFWCIKKSLGVMRTPPTRSGTQAIFWERLPILFRYHAITVQNFAYNKSRLLKRLHSGLHLRKALIAVRQREMGVMFKNIIKAIYQNPIEPFRYCWFRLQQRSRK